MSAYEFKLPDVGEGLSEGEIVRWHVAPGDSVKADQIIVDVQTDKAVVEIPAPVGGTIKALGGDVGDIVPVGALLAVIDADVAVARTAAKPAEAAPPIAVEAEAKSKAKPEAGRVLASPATRKLAAELGVDLAAVECTGNRGQVTRDDVRRAAEGEAPSRPASKPAPARVLRPEGEDRVEPLRGLRRQIAVAMAAAWRDIPHILSAHNVDAGGLVAARRALNAEFEGEGIKLSYLPLFVKACAAALRRHPRFNASLDVDKGEIVYRHRINIGIATATPEGLVVPVVRDADAKPIVEIAREIEALAQAARERKVTVEQLQGGTFTITNYGSYGATFGTPIIRPPEVAIAGFGAIQDMVVPVDGAPAVRPILPLVVSTDHRLNDGEHLGQFADTLQAFLKEPVRLLGAA